MKKIKGRYYFSSGREMPEGCDDTVGINGDLIIGFGYDEQGYTPDCDYIEDDDYKKLTAEECVELADMMIERWQSLRAKYKQTKGSE